MQCHSKVRGSQQPRIRKVNEGAEKRTERGHRGVGIDFGFRNFKNSRRDLEIIYHRELSSHISLQAQAGRGWLPTPECVCSVSDASPSPTSEHCGWGRAQKKRFEVNVQRRGHKSMPALTRNIKRMR